MVDNKNNSSKSKIILIIIILILIVMILSATYAYFILLISKEEDSTRLYTGTLDVQYEQGNIMYGDMFYPRSRPVDLNDDFRTYINSFTVTNTGTLDGYVRIGLDVSENEFPDNALSYRIFNESGVEFLSGTISSEDSFTLADNLFMRSGESASYTIQIWLEENGMQQNKSKGKKMVAAIEVTETQIIE